MTSFRRRRCVVVVDVVVAKTLTSLQRRDDDGVSVSVVVLTSKSQGCSLGLEFLGLETVSRRFFERLGLGFLRLVYNYIELQHWFKLRTIQGGPN